MKRIKTTAWAVLLCLPILLSSLVFAAGEIPQAFTFDGRLYSDSTGGTPMNDPNVTIKIQILDQTQSCVLYEETQSGMDTTTSSGYFTIQVGSAPAAGKRTNDSGHTMAQVYSNTGGAISGNLVSNGAVCNYVPVSGDQRFVRMSVTPSLTGVVSTLSPNMPLDSVPNAVVAERAESLQGYLPANFAQLNTTSPADLSQANLENIFSITNYPALTALLAGTSTHYTKIAGNGATALPNLTAPASPAAGQMWYDSGTIKYYNGSTTQTLGVSGAGISSLVVGTGLTPTGTITTSGNIAVDVGTTVGKIVQVQAAGKLPVLDGSNLTSLNGSALTSGTIGGTAAISTSGNLQTSGSITSYRNFLYDNAGAGPGFVGFQAPADIAGSGGASYTMIFPNTRGLAGEVLSTNGSGVLSWISPTTGSVTSITGTAPITITGTASVPIVNVSPATVSSTGVVTLASNGGTTASTVVQATDSRLADSRVPSGAAGGDLSGTYPAPTVARIQGTAVSATAPTTAGQVLRYNGTSWLPNFVAMTDLRSTVTGTNQFASSCLNNQTLTYNSVGDVMSCQNIAVSDSQVTFGSKTQNTFLAAPNGSAGAPTFRALAAADLPSGVVTTGTYRSVTVDTYGRVIAGTAPTTLSGYSISDAVQNLAGTPGLQTGLDASKPATPAAGTVYFATDTNRIWQYNAGAWATIASASGTGGTITALTGDVSASGSGSVVSTVNSVGTSTAANIHNAELLANAATDLNTFSTIVKRNASGNFTAGTVTANLTGNVVGNLTGNVTGTVTGAASLNVLKAGDTMTGHLTHAANFGDVYTAGAGVNTATIQGPTTAIGTSYVLRLPTSVAGANGQVMTSDTSGNLSWTTPSTTATSYSGVLPVANGGTNSSTTLTNNKVMVSAGGAIVESAALTNGQLLIGSTSAAPVVANISAGSGISVTNGAGSITVATTGLGSTTLADGRIWVGQTTTPTQVTPGGDIAMTNTGSFAVNAIKGVTVSAAPTITGQVLRYNGTNITPNFVGMTDLRSNVTGSVALASSCAANQTLTYNSASDNLTCSNIGISASQITSGTLGVANGGIGSTTLTGAGIFTNGGNSFGAAAVLGTGDANSLTLNTSGSPRMTILSGGNVGIGTTNPLAKQNIFESVSSALQTQLLLQNQGSSTNSAGIGFQVSSSGEYTTYGPKAGILFERTNPNGRGSLKFMNRSTDDTAGFAAADERMRIDASGNVGIGTASPSVALDILSKAPSSALHPYRAGVVVSAEGTDVGGRVGAKAASAIEAPMFWGYRSRGTLASPQAVQLGDEIASINGSGFDGSSWTGSLGGKIAFNAEENWSSTNHGSYMAFLTAASGPSGSYGEKMRLTGTGNLGIGTGSPTRPLEIEKTVSGEFNAIHVSNVAGSPFNTSDSVSISLGRSSNSGHVMGKITASNKDTGSFADGYLAFGTNISSVNTEKMRITNTGNVGIGTTGPGGKLEVNSGAANATTGIIISTTTAGANTYQSYIANGSVIGSVSSPSGTGIAFNTTSDVRLKGGFQPVSSPLQTLDQIDVANFYYLADPAHQRMDGFKAQQLFEILPYAVTKPEKDFDDEGKLIPWLADYSKVVPLVAAAVKELYEKWTHDSGTLHREIASVKTSFNDKTVKLEVENAILKRGHAILERDTGELKLSNQAKDRKIEKLEQENTAIKSWICSKEPYAAICK